MYPSFDVLLQQRILVFLIAAIIGSSISWLAAREGYYRLPVHGHAHKPIPWLYVLGAFGLFLCVEIIIVPSFYLIWLSFKQGGMVIPSAVHLDSETQGWINLIAMVVTGIALLIYYFEIDKDYRRQIWGDGHSHKTLSIVKNLGLGALTWVIVYPWIIALSQIIGIILQFNYQGPHIDQVAIKHLKEAFSHPALLWMTGLAVVTIVPCLEELLFRGFLQTWLKGLFGTGKAIVITSVIFATFHYSASQGIENIELLSSLFLLSCYLGFIRERQNSLWASIGLHSTFNTISLLMIFLGS